MNVDHFFYHFKKYLFIHSGNNKSFLISIFGTKSYRWKTQESETTRKVIFKITDKVLHLWLLTLHSCHLSQDIMECAQVLVFLFLIAFWFDYSWIGRIILSLCRSYNFTGSVTVKNTQAEIVFPWWSPKRETNKTLLIFSSGCFIKYLSSTLKAYQSHSNNLLRQ